jgi:hypothetical protein
MTQQNQLGTVLHLSDTEMMPSIVLIYRKNIETTPYVNALAKRQTMDLFDSPRYSTGYTSLFNTIDLLLKHTC